MNPAFTLTALEVHQRATPAAWDDLCMVMGGAPTPLDADDILSRWQGPSSPELRGAVRALVRNAGNVSGPEVLVALRTIEGLDDATSAPDVPKGATSNATPAPLPYPSKQQEAAA